MSTSFYSRQELLDLGLRSVGEEVAISRKASIYGAASISVGNRARIDDFCVLAGGSGIELGSYIHIACFCALYGASGIIMQDFSGLSARVTIYSESDDYSGRSLTNPMTPASLKPSYHRGQVVLGRHAIIGANSTILPGVSLGEGAAVGAHSLVTKSCDAWTMYFGCPAKRLKPRSRKLLELEAQLLAERETG